MEQDIFYERTSLAPFKRERIVSSDRGYSKGDK